MMIEQLIPAPVAHAGQIYATCLAGQEPMVRDLDLAEYLGYEARREIRRLIDRHSESLGEVSRYRNAKPSSPTGGRPEECYYLNERQTLYICAKSETPKANEVLGAMIEVFVQVRRGTWKQEAPSVPLETSLRMASIGRRARRGSSASHRAGPRPGAAWARPRRRPPCTRSPA